MYQAVNMIALTVFMSSSAQAGRDYKFDQTEKTKRTDIFQFYVTCFSLYPVP